MNTTKYGFIAGLLLLLLSGCVKDESSTDSGLVTDSGSPPKEAFCPNTVVYGDVPILTVIDSVDHCTSVTGRLEKSSFKLDDLDVYGQDGSLNPGYGSTRVRRTDYGTFDGTSSYKGTSTGTGYDWKSVNHNAGTLACDPTSDCSGTYEVEIIKGSATTCEEYSQISPCFRWGEVSGSSKSADADTSCTSGSGRFRLAAWQRDDKDADGDYGYTLIPIKKSGTGTMTNAAWVTNIDIVEDESLQLHVQKIDEQLFFTSADLIEDKANMVHTLSASGTNTFGVGLVRGNPSFVVEDAPLGTAAFEVDMSWTCSSSGFANVSQTTGYVVNSDDLGCGYDQDIVVRPIAGGDRVQLQVYGNPLVKLEVPTQINGTERDFTFSRGALQLEGSLVSWNGTSAVVDVDVMKAGVLNVCSTGRYTLNAE